MSVTPSLTHALLPAGTDLSGLGARVARHAGGEASLRPGDRAGEVAFGGYRFFLVLGDGTGACSELGELRDVILKVATDDERGQTFGAVLTFGGLSPDPDMDHFNDAVFLMEEVEALCPGAILFDPQSGERIP
ncbi:hypothetical protein GCM10008956_02850 [Deinococcus arenae]|uniref:Uncharacterized protein n=1 Tax=Deinococcus arenae TaxID=1452751 RepID=A0A8H9L6A8_9DEIO|nr:hypothetical protein [Deinococcus arenae]AWT35992.1 hypothetical protein DM785_10770 [Deinococcus actinosclerus]GGM30248.1 hypothetical protein GCM10008956_02850 [Deinococcus arenae]